MKLPMNLRIPSSAVLALSLLFTSCKKGDQGPTGTANVIYSDWMDVTFTSSNQTTYLAWQASITAPKLTSTIVSTGQMQVYVNIGATDQPNVVAASDIGVAPIFTAGTIGLLATTSLTGTDDFSTYTTSGKKYYQYRYVLIPGGTSANSSINLQNYKEVQQAVGMKD